MNATAKVTSKGQVTLPREVREFLGSQIIEFEIEEGRVVITPVRSVAGSLARYAKEYRPLTEVRDKTWSDVANEKC